MSTFLSPYVVALVIGVAGVALMVFAAAANRLLAPRGSEAAPASAPDAEPNGSRRPMPALGPHYSAVLVYAAAVAAIAYLFPWAAIFAAPGFGLPSVVAMTVFGALPAAGAVYAVRRGVGTWR